ncbi:hypothetical protein MMC27_004095 [Xylographa pallens]|nr:hypothetical protein [Xylographa pallens]
MLETIYHVWSYGVPSPPRPLDAPFYTTCQEPDPNGPRANATILMLARNSDVEGAVKALTSVEQQFNQWYQYPVVFLNDKPWGQHFIDSLTSVASGEVHFEFIDSRMWGFPDWIDQRKAQRKMDAQEASGLMYAGTASYHHMCRFNSGMFYDHPALQKYKWYWRVDPDVHFTCAIPYDPFIEMEKHNKKYGYTIALWERGKTVPSLFRKISDWKKTRKIRTTSLWNAMIDPSYLPWPIRRFLSLLRNRDAAGDIWNMCHFWSNFEIADMDFFRSPEYREFFDFLDADGGFYFERWGDAPVHSLAAALYLSPSELHHFSDFGYVHPPFQYCPVVEKDPGKPLPHLTGSTSADLKQRFKTIGCRCDFDFGVKIIDPTCMNTINRALV